MKPILPLLCILCGPMVLAAAEPPNILVIFTDDHGWADLGVQGVNAEIRTPNVDQLARDGVRFPRGYVTAPQCTPSRAGLISGQYQAKIGVEQNGMPLRSEIVTLPERLKQVGYVTGISGKWHLDVEDQGGDGGKKNVVHPELGPWGQGFDEYFSGFMQDYDASHALDGTPYPDAPKKIREEGCRVVLQTEWALQFLKRRAAQVENREPRTQNREPFFLYLSYMAPHTPLEFPEPFISQVPKDLPRERRSALALIAAIDDGVGRIRQQLRAMGQEENTLVFFLADNGAPLGSSAPGKRKIWDGSINLPMRGQKGMLSEGGIRVPFLAAWPGKIPAGQIFEHPVISLDIAATAAKVAGASAPSGAAEAAATLDGVNLLPHLTGEDKTAPHDALYWRWVDQAAIQQFPHKLILPGGDARPLLFDITDPENETHTRDLSADHPEIVARLRGKLDSWLATLKPPGPPEPLAPHRAENFVEAGILPGTAAPAAQSPAEPEGSIEGWICRNGSFTKTGDHLTLKPASETQRGPRLFLSNTQVNLQGPVTATLRLRAKTGGPGTLTWRTKTDSFTPAQTATFDWPAGAEFQEVKVELPETGRIIHLRLTPPREGSGLELQSLELRGKTGAPHLLEPGKIK